MRPGLYRLWKTFEPKLLPGDCASNNFTVYAGTRRDGVGPFAVTDDRYKRAGGAGDGTSSFCPKHLQAVYADMHDGDKKEVTIEGTSMTIRPSGNNQTWQVNALVDTKSCSAVIDFNVPGKPGPPPVNLTATLWYSFTATVKKTEFEFTDPSGTLAAKGYPLNRWVELPKAHKAAKASGGVPPCHPDMDTVFADMHDGDKKAIMIAGDGMTIRPSGNTQKWSVTTTVDRSTCSANINFHVPGKPGPPPVNLTATLFYSMSASAKKAEFEFTDPSGTLAAPHFPLNKWVQIGKIGDTFVV